jgi:heme/copper-type cytochrome/quinol oxidase subunit 2
MTTAAPGKNSQPRNIFSTIFQCIFIGIFIAVFVALFVGGYKEDRRKKGDADAIEMFFQQSENTLRPIS